MNKLMMMIGAAGCLALGTLMPMVALATDLDGYSFRYDFSSGAKVLYYGEGWTKNPMNSVDLNVLAVTGPDGQNTAVHPTVASSAPYGTGYALNADWTLALSVRPGKVETGKDGVLFSLGRLNTGSRKAVALCSSSDATKLKAHVLKRSGNTKSVEKELLLDEGVVDSSGFHTVVIIHKAPASGNNGTLTFYVDGAFQTSYTTTSGFIFGDVAQFCATVSGNVGTEVETAGQRSPGRTRGGTPRSIQQALYARARLSAHTA